MKKILIALLALGCIMPSVKNVNATTGNELVAPAAYSYPCDNCNGVVIRETYSNQFIKYINQPCSHGKRGDDKYAMYGTKYVDRCSSCGAVDVSYVNTRLVLDSCQGV